MIASRSRDLLRPNLGDISLQGMMLTVGDLMSRKHAVSQVMTNSESPMAQTTGAIAAMVEAELIGAADIAISGLAPVDQARAGQLTFIHSVKYAKRWPESSASAALVSRSIAARMAEPGSRALLVVDDAEAALLALLSHFAPPHHGRAPGVHPAAVVDPSAVIDPTASIGPFSVVGPGTTVERGVVLVGQVFLGADVSIGRDSVLHPGVRVLDRCHIGEACQLWPNVVVGADGFGYRPAPDGRGVDKIPHIGDVVIGKQVEIGANTSIDRAKLGSTIIGDGTKIDNHCQIGHNCVIGRSVVICGMSGVAGSVTINDGAVIAGHVGIADHVVIGAGAVLAAKAGVICDVPAGETWFGTPAGRHRDQMRSYAALKKLPEALRRLERIEEQHSEGERGK